MRQKIFLPVEIKAREFHSKVLFSLFAAEHGFEVFLGGQCELWDRLPKLGKGIYIDKSTAITKRYWYRYFRSLGNNIVAWDEEGLVIFSDEVFHATRMDPECFEQVDTYFAWGPNEMRAILSKYPHAADKVFATGNPRIDLLREGIRDYCASSVQRLRETHGPIILVNTNFPIYNNFKGFDAGLKIFDDYPMASFHDFKAKYLEFTRRGYEGFMDAIPLIRNAFPSHTIIIRPAPVENSDPWVERFGADDGIVVTKEGNVVEWIQAADAVIQFNCTTAVESFLLGVPVIAYRCVRSDMLEPELPNACSMDAFSQEELISQLSHAIQARRNKEKIVLPAEKQQIVDRYIADLDGPPVCERIVKILSERTFPARPVTLEKVPMIKRAWRHILKLVRRPDPMDVQYYRAKFPGMTVAEVKTLAEGFSASTGRFQNVKISRHNSDIIKIHNS
jgi:surface carbohydrate biosynthesis protein